MKNLEDLRRRSKTVDLVTKDAERQLGLDGSIDSSTVTCGPTVGGSHVLVSVVANKRSRKEQTVRIWLQQADAARLAGLLLRAQSMLAAQAIESQLRDFEDRTAAADDR